MVVRSSREFSLNRKARLRDLSHRVTENFITQTGVNSSGIPFRGDGFRSRGDVTELFDVGVIPNIRCPRGIGPLAPGLEEAMRGRIWVDMA